MHPNIVGIAIGTRADCMDKEILELLSEINKKTLLWIEIGLQSSNDETAKIINRGYTTEVFLKKVEELKERNIKVLAHVIIGLPKETEKEVLETIYFLNKIKIWGVKIHLLYILKNTKLYNYYGKYPWKIMTKEEYIKIVCKVIKVLDKNIIIHRLTGDA